MTERVQVVVEAKDAASGVLRGITAQMGQLGAATEQLTGSSINWGNVAAAATRMVADAVKDAFDVSTKYAASVRDLALASGASAEQSSRLLQVLDDFEIQAGDITTATKAMTKNGLEPTIQTIATLSDQYLQLTTAQERNAFITENLGRGGAKWANVLKEGSAAILEMNAGVSENLIMNDELIAQYEEMRLNQDEWNDNVEGMKIALVNGLVPAINDAVELNRRLTEAIHEEEMALGRTVGWMERNAIQTKVMAQMDAEAAKAADKAAASFWEQSYAVKASAKAAAEAAPDYGKLLTQARGLNDATREQIKLAGYTALEQKMKESGGEITQDEAEALQQVGEELGIFDRSAVNAANAVETLSSQMADGTITAMEYAAALNAIPTQITTTLSTGGTMTTYTNTSAGGGPLSCFITGTLIYMADGSSKEIQDVRPGDMVVSYDTAKGVFLHAVVAQTFTHEHTQGFLYINGIGATAEHPFFVNGQWMEAGKIKIGDELLNKNGLIEKVKSLAKVGDVVTVYNLEVDDTTHNYFADGILVHNKAEGGWARGPGDGSRDTFLSPLANGEFVVNARDARRNAAALESMNSGGDGANASNYFYGNTTFMINGDGSGFMEQR